MDTNGNVYLAGETFGALLGQISAGPTDDAFLRKYSPGGDEVWTRQFGTPESDSALGVAVDGEGNVYVAGGTGSFLPGQVSAGRDDAFLRKYAPAGTELWTRQFGYPDSSDEADSVAVDAEGNVYVVDSTDSTPEGKMDHAERKTFLRKYDSAGRELWSRLFEEPFNFVTSVVTDGVGNVYVAGSTTGGKVTGDAVIVKYDSNGEELWTRQFGSPQSDSGVRRQNKWDKRGAFKACNLDANRLRQFSDLPTSVRLDSFASPPVSSPVWRLAVRGTYPPA